MIGLSKVKDLLLHCDCGDKKCKSVLFTNYYNKFIEITLCDREDNYSVMIYPSQIKKILKFLKGYDADRNSGKD